MAWNDYVFDYENGHKFESSRYQVSFNLLTDNTKTLVKDMEYKQEVSNHSEYSYEITSVASGTGEDKYAIAWFTITDASSYSATGVGMNSFTDGTYLLPNLSWSDNLNPTIYPLGAITSSNRSPFVLPNQTIERKVTCNFPILAICGTRHNEYEYTQAIGQQAIRNYTLTGEWDTYIKPWIDVGMFASINYNPSAQVEPVGSEYTIYNTAQKGTWKLGDIVENVSTPFYRWVRVKLASSNNVDGRLAFYKGGLVDGSLRLYPVSTADVVACEYSTDGGGTWTESDSFPFEYIYDVRTDELGTFIYATRTGVGGSQGVPIFDDETTATGWVNHDSNVSITDASNYEDIANRYKYTNKTGDNETSTTMGTASGFRSHFTQKYILDRGDVSTIANAMFDTTTNIFEDIKKGLECYGERIIDSICSLTWYPIDLTTVFTQLQNQSYIFFGGYQFQPTGLNVNKLVGYSGFIDLGSFTVEPTFPNLEDARNYSPFCRVSIYLPYCGTFELDYNTVVNKTIRVRYYIDINTGSCMACLFDSATDGRLITYMNGNMGTPIPITITDYSGFANAELKNISNLAGVGVNLATGGFNAISGYNALQTAGTKGETNEALRGIAEGIEAIPNAPVDFAKAMYNLSTTSINNFNSTKGCSGAVGNQYLPQYVYLIFEYVQTEETPNLIQLEGKPSNKSGTINSFSGYLEVDSVQLQCSGATEREKAEILKYLNSGIII